MHSRLSVLPDEAEPLQRSQLMAALSIGTEIIQLRHVASRLGLTAYLDTALEAIVQGNSAMAKTRLAQLDHHLASRRGTEPGAALALRARGPILAISETLAEHASYFDAGAPA